MVNQCWPLQQIKEKDLYIPSYQQDVKQGKTELRIFNLRSDIINIVKDILAPAKLVPSSCASAPSNTREAGISSILQNL